MYFWIETINLPLPKEFISAANLPEEPPPIASVLGNLLPTILTKKYLTNAVGHQSALVRHTICLLIFAILNKVKKLKLIIESKESSWQVQLDSILESMLRRLPEFSSILTLYSKSSDYPLTATCSIKVLSLYSELLSSITSNQNIDAKSLVPAFQKEWTLMTPIDILDKMYLLRFIHEHSEITWWSRSSNPPAPEKRLLISLGPGQSLLATLLRKRISTHHPLAKQQMEFALDKLIRRGNAFQSVTTMSPILEVCHAIDDTVEDEPDDLYEVLVEFIEDSFFRFMQQPYSFFDETASLISEEQAPCAFSSILVTFRQQWKYLRNKEKDVRKFTIITEWICHFFLRLVLIGECSGAVVNLLASMDDNGNDKKISQLLEDISRWSPNSSAGDQKLLLPGSRYYLTDIVNSNIG